MIQAHRSAIVFRHRRQATAHRPPGFPRWRFGLRILQRSRRKRSFKTGAQGWFMKGQAASPAACPASRYFFSADTPTVGSADSPGSSTLVVAAPLPDCSIVCGKRPSHSFQRCASISIERRRR